jgi:hypothetical protein
MAQTLIRLEPLTEVHMRYLVYHGESNVLIAIFLHNQHAIAFSKSLGEGYYVVGSSRVAHI